MNIYDQKSISCSKCGKFIGEINYDAIVTFPMCGNCANPIPDDDAKISHMMSKYNKRHKVRDLNLVMT